MSTETSVETQVLTVEEISRLALPLGTSVVASGDAVNRPVHWAVIAGGDAPLPYLEGGELVLFVPGQGDPTAPIIACPEANAAAVPVPTAVPCLALPPAHK